MRRLALLLLLILLPAIARAGRTRFGWLYDVEVVPLRTAEIETWVFEENGKGDPDVDETVVWWAPVFGMTDRLEIALPIELVYERSEGMGGTELARFGAEARWRLTDPDPVESGPFAPLLRLGVKRLVTQRDTSRFEPGVVLGLDIGRVHAVADLGGVVKLRDDGETELEARPGAGVTVRVVGELWLGAEFYSEIGLGDSDAVDWYTVGPCLSFTRGRLWISASFPIGLKNIDSAPRLNWALAF